MEIPIDAIKDALWWLNKGLDNYDFNSDTYYVRTKQSSKKISKFIEQVTKEITEDRIQNTNNRFLKEICKNCGLTFGSHYGGTFLYPRDYCPGHEGRMDWENGPGTCFEPSGLYKEENES